MTFAEDEADILNRILSIYTEETKKVKSHSSAWEFPGLYVHSKQRRVECGGKEIPLTKTEFDVLFYLLQRPGQIFSHEQIYHAVYQSEKGKEGVDNRIYCLIRSLRKKIEADPRRPRYICTVRGIGYKFAIPEA